jgi:hypothetical protein
MADDPEVVYFGSAQVVSDSDITREDEGVEGCALCSHPVPVVVRDVGIAIIGELAVARWWPLCQECADLADAGDRERLSHRARLDSRDEGWEGLVADALVMGNNA